MSLNEFLGMLSGWVWGWPLLVLLVGTGVYLTLRLGFLQFRTLPYALKLAFKPSTQQKGEKGDISHYQALTTALAATIGTGNIAGVATAVVLGGPGAVFWMWITAVFGMATKYAEAILAVKYRVENKNGEMSGGPMYYLERGRSKMARRTFRIFWSDCGIRYREHGSGEFCIRCYGRNVQRSDLDYRHPSARFCRSCSSWRDPEHRAGHCIFRTDHGRFLHHRSINYHYYKL